MENIIIDLKLKITELQKENAALKTKMTLLYCNWNFDNERFQELKAKCRQADINNNNIQPCEIKETLRRSIASSNLDLL